MSKTIFHISDIHIGSNKERNEEYKEIFIKLSNYIRQENPTVVCITGDIFHNKTRYSGEDVDLFFHLIRCISICPIIIIPGNHDMNMNNNTIDLISPLLKETQVAQNINYWSETGIFSCCNIKFIHVGLKSKTEEIKKLMKIAPDAILLYHGMVNGAKFGKMIIKNSKIDDEIIKNAHMILLGDIHEQQFIRPNIGYAGSLIQQNLGESNNKGYILWNLNMRRGFFKVVENQKRFVKLDLCGKSEEEANALINKNMSPSIIKMSITTDTRGEKYIKQMKPINAAIKLNIKSGNEFIDNYENILRDVVKRNGGTPEQIENIITQYKDRITKQGCRKWSIKSMQWDNMYKYGFGNFIDFSRFKGICGAVAPNRAGKSTILDILLFGLFGRTIRGTKKNMIHKDNKVSFVKVKFIVNNVDYYVERSDDVMAHTYIRLFKGAENITEQSTTETHKKIESLIGSYDQFLTTGLYYDGKKDIIKMDRAERFRILPILFGLEDGNIIIKELKDELKNVRTKISNLIRPRESEPQKEYEKIYEKLKSFMIKYKEEDKSTNELSEKLAHLKIKKAQIKPPSKINIDGQKIKTLESAAAAINVSYEVYKIMPKETETYNINKKIIAAATNILSLPSIIELETELKIKKENFEQLSPQEYKEVRFSIQRAESAIRDKTAKLKKCQENEAKYLQHVEQIGVSFVKTKLTFNQYCLYCKKNSNILNIKKNSNGDPVLKSCAAEIQNLQSEIAEHNNVLFKKNERLQILEKNKIAADEIAKLERQLIEAKKAEKVKMAKTAVAQYEEKYKQMQLCKKRSNLLLQAEQLKKEMGEQEAALLKAKELPAINCEIEKLTMRLNEIKQNAEKFNRMSGFLKAELNRLKTEIKIKEQYDEQSGKLAAEESLLKLYMKSMGADGLQMEIIKLNMARIIEQSNKILLNITKEFKLTYDIDDRQIDIKINNGAVEIPVDMGSAFERFIISIILRLVLTGSLYTSPDFLMLDEGFGCMDVENLKKVEDVLTELKDSYGYIFLITHIDSIENIIENPIFIYQEDKTSYINTLCPSRNKREVLEFIEAFKKKNEIYYKTKESNMIEAIKGDKNKDKFKIKCVCGKSIFEQNLDRHKKSKYHKEHAKD